VCRLASPNEPSNCTDASWLWPGVAWRLRSLAGSLAPRSFGSARVRMSEKAERGAAGLPRRISEGLPGLCQRTGNVDRRDGHGHRDADMISSPPGLPVDLSPYHRTAPPVPPGTVRSR
jgi:hypothetical protein